MKLVDQHVELLRADSVEMIERAGRTCYESEDRVSAESAGPFVEKLIRLGHTAMLEHAGATLRFVTDRGASHELVRYRLASFAQESTRYVRYGGDMEFVRPVWFGLDYKADMVFTEACEIAERHYRGLLEIGQRPEQARQVLPHALKTEVVVTANYREWRHILALRALGTTGRPHPQIQLLMRLALRTLASHVWPVFRDLLGDDIERLTDSEAF